VDRETKGMWLIGGCLLAFVVGEILRKRLVGLPVRAGRFSNRLVGTPRQSDRQRG